MVRILTFDWTQGFASILLALEIVGRDMVKPGVMRRDQPPPRSRATICRITYMKNLKGNGDFHYPG